MRSLWCVAGAGMPLLVHDRAAVELTLWFVVDWITIVIISRGLTLSAIPLWDRWCRHLPGEGCTEPS